MVVFHFPDSHSPFMSFLKLRYLKPCLWIPLSPLLGFHICPSFTSVREILGWAISLFRFFQICYDRKFQVKFSANTIHIWTSWICLWCTYRAVKTSRVVNTRLVPDFLISKQRTVIGWSIANNKSFSFILKHMAWGESWVWIGMEIQVKWVKMNNINIKFAALKRAYLYIYLNRSWWVLIQGGLYGSSRVHVW